MNGVVQSGSDRRPHARATVTLHHVSRGQTTKIGRATTLDSGSFSVAPVVVPSSTGGDFFYATAFLGDGVILMAILGTTIPSDPDNIGFVINELTTIAAAYSAAQLFTDGGGIEGSSLALSIAAAMSANLVDITTGSASSVMTNSPNADQTNACRSLMSLANFLATAVIDRGKPLQDFLALTTLPNQPPPTNTVQGLVNLAKHPANRVGGIYAQSKLANIYGPVLTAQPLAWTIVVKVNDSGDDTRMFGGPGSLAFDSQGNAWIPNNVLQGTPNSSLYSIVLDRSGRPLSDANGTVLSPFEGGGLLGAGLGLAVDASDDIWIGNFGWGTEPGDIPEGGVSKFQSDTTPISPAPNGYQNGGMLRVQGTVFDAAGNLWMAGWGNGTVVCYRKGNPDDYAIYGDSSGKFKPFCIAFAKDGTAWVTNSDSASDVRNIVLGSDVSMKCIRKIEIGDVLKGIQIDSAGNIWLASGDDHHVYVLDAHGNFIGGYQGGGTNGPWGITLDGDDNLWVGNFGPLETGSIFHGRLTQLAGIHAQGYRFGDGMTPPTGYTLPSEGDPVLLADGTPLYGPGAPPCTIPMMRTTGLNIDAAGNVWTCNNWKPDFTSDAIDDPYTGGQGNPGGDGMLIWVGLAKPRS